MNRFTTILIAAVLAGLSPPAFADKDHSGHKAATEPAAGAASMAEGEVRKVDKEARKITLRHGELKHLEMPAMTMVFQVKDPALLDKVKAGDKVRFSAEQREGVLVVTAIEPAP